MVILEVRERNGHVRRCTSRCYGAKDAECDCVCGGHNHGVGLKKAREQSLQHGQAWLREYTKKHRLRGAVRRVNPDLAQEILEMDEEAQP